jgi:hypothetical protein
MWPYCTAMGGREAGGFEGSKARQDTVNLGFASWGCTGVGQATRLRKKN